MSGYIEKEDGTGLIELEDGTGFILLEELPPAPPPPYATWKVGTITVPGSTGDTVITGLGGTPAAVFFFGTNWSTEDSAVTTTGTGIFRGMASPKWDDPGTIVQSAAFTGPAGDQHIMDNIAVIASTTAGTSTNLYGAFLASFDVDGFTLTWFTVATTYKIVYVALMDVGEVGAFFTSGGGANPALGWKAGAMMLHGAWSGPSIGGDDRTQEFYGSAAYPGTGGGSSWYGAGLTAFTFPTAAGSGQYDIGVYNNEPDVLIAHDGNFIGPFFSTQNVVAYPSGGSLTDFYVSTNTTDNSAMVTVWDDEDNQTGRLTPGEATDDTATVSGLPFAPGLVIGYTISDEPTEQGSGSTRGAVGFSVATPDYQWCAIVDGGGTRGSFQSFQRGFADTVSGTTVHAGTIELTDDGFILTTEEDDVAANEWVWHAFGHPERIVMWVPHIYRRVLGT